MVRTKTAHICAGTSTFLATFFCWSSGYLPLNAQLPHRWIWIIRLENILFSYIIYEPAALNSILVCIPNPTLTNTYTHEKHKLSMAGVPAFNICTNTYKVNEITFIIWYNIWILFVIHFFGLT